MLIDRLTKEAKSKKVIVYSDMDGVLVEYCAGQKELILNNEKDFYLNQRPIFSVINKMKQLSEIENIEIGIMSQCYFQEQKRDKILWLEKYCPFIKKQNINIIVLNEESYTKDSKYFLKIQKIRSLNEGENRSFYLIEDEHKIIKNSNKICPNVAHHFSELLD